MNGRTTIIRLFGVVAIVIILFAAAVSRLELRLVHVLAVAAILAIPVAVFAGWYWGKRK